MPAKPSLQVRSEGQNYNQERKAWLSVQVGFKIQSDGQTKTPAETPSISPQSQTAA